MFSASGRSLICKACDSQATKRKRIERRQREQEEIAAGVRQPKQRTPYPKKQPIERFHQNYIIAESGCWEWQRKVHGGIPEFHVGNDVNGKKFSAQARRWLYEFQGGIVPEGMIVSNTCKDPACVNPDHFLVRAPLPPPKSKVKFQPVTRGCVRCGKTFMVRGTIARNTPAIFCGRVCANLAKRTGEHRTCKACGVEFYRSPSRVDNGPHSGEYCSKRCWGVILADRLRGKSKTPEHRENMRRARLGVPNINARKPPMVKVCIQCGEAFELSNKGTIAFRNSRRFCSAVCRTEYRLSHPEESPWRKPLAQIPCEQCGEMFGVKPYIALGTSTRRRFCWT